MWLLGSPHLGGSHTASDMLLEDRHLLRQLDAALLVRPAGRLLLPLAVAPSPEQLARLRLWVDDSDDVDANGCWAKALQQPSPGGFVAVTVFKQPEGVPTSTVPRRSNVPGSVGTRLLLSNPHVKLWDFHVPSGSSCELHEHLHPYVFFNRAPCETRGLDEALQPSGSVTTFEACEFRRVEVTEEERHVHAFQNPGKVDVQQYIIEFVG